jgi:hypothetical protein
MADTDDTLTLTVSERIIEAVAEREGVSPTALAQPLNEVIDPEALDTLFEPQPNGEQRSEGRVEFQYYGYTVTVDMDGSVRLDAD